MQRHELAGNGIVWLYFRGGSQNIVFVDGFRCGKTPQLRVNEKCYRVFDRGMGADCRSNTVELDAEPLCSLNI